MRWNQAEGVPIVVHEGCVGTETERKREPEVPLVMQEGCRSSGAEGRPAPKTSFGTPGLTSGEVLTRSDLSCFWAGLLEYCTEALEGQELLERHWERQERTCHIFGFAFQAELLPSFLPKAWLALSREGGLRLRRSLRRSRRGFCLRHFRPPSSPSRSRAPRPVGPSASRVAARSRERSAPA